MSLLAAFTNEGPARKESGKRGRKPGRKSADKVDMRAKLERSRQSARECRARKKLRYQYLEELVADREKAVFALRKEIEQYSQWAKQIDAGQIPEGIQETLEDIIKQERTNNSAAASATTASGSCPN
ncbi:unnamed protein product [Acanthoscelides obtectus]|uniref:BZIP domain-containing protein n=1 Tax=Acanthoscelides obtectus TaxID=200917 RepID=A0A9P0PKQ3_ACAOB|nr:unnamed protein product [Acanthoscelides obtectus]CAK1637798.1 cAMP-responsive element-binding protein-like 2 [Acanthoscelides obtectus]